MPGGTNLDMNLGVQSAQLCARGSLVKTSIDAPNNQSWYKRHAKGRKRCEWFHWKPISALPTLSPVLPLHPTWQRSNPSRRRWPLSGSSRTSLVGGRRAARRRPSWVCLVEVKTADLEGQVCIITLLIKWQVSKRQLVKDADNDGGLCH